MLTEKHQQIECEERARKKTQSRHLHIVVRVCLRVRNGLTESQFNALLISHFIKYLESIAIRMSLFIWYFNASALRANDTTDWTLTEWNARWQLYFHLRYEKWIRARKKYSNMNSYECFSMQMFGAVANHNLSLSVLHHLFRWIHIHVVKSCCFHNLNNHKWWSVSLALAYAIGYSVNSSHHTISMRIHFIFLWFLQLYSQQHS